MYKYISYISFIDLDNGYFYDFNILQLYIYIYYKLNVLKYIKKLRIV